MLVDCHEAILAAFLDTGTFPSLFLLLYSHFTCYLWVVKVSAFAQDFQNDIF